MKNKFQGIPHRKITNNDPPDKFQGIPHRKITGKVSVAWLKKASRQGCADLALYILHERSLINLTLKTKLCQEFGLSKKLRVKRLLKLQSVGLVLIHERKAGMPFIFDVVFTK